MPALQRSCDACVTAKRRCDLVTPRCARCTTKKIDCSYANEPVPCSFNRKRACDEAAYKNLALGSVGSRSTLSKSTFEGGSKAPILGMEILGYRVPIPEVIRSYDSNTLQKQTKILRSFVVDFSQNRAAAFLHPQLYLEQLPQPLEDTHDVCSAYISKDGSSESENLRPKASQMVRRAARSNSYDELVVRVQATALIWIICLLEGGKHPEKEMDRDNQTFSNLAEILFCKAPMQLPQKLSPWQAWAFAESVRRTILVCYIALAVDGALRRGFATHLLCVEALVLDIRSGVWDARSVNEWGTARASSRDPELVSLREFSSLQGKGRGSTPFEDLISMTFK